MAVRRHLNTLYVTSEGAYVRKQGRSLVVARAGQDDFRVPIHMLESVVILTRSGASPAAMALCAENSVAMSFLTPTGRFLARVEGPVSGNVLLRRAQFFAFESEERSLRIAQAVVVGKIYNVRVLLRRAARDHDDPGRHLASVSDALGGCMRRLTAAADLEVIRGIEGEAARRYFSVLDRLILPEVAELRFSGRTRRPPRDPVNALLSFTYSLLTRDARAACEATGLDPQVGFLHRLRPGRPSLALDLVEELRSVVAERVVLTLINRRQVGASDFSTDEVGACTMKKRARDIVLAEYQARKSAEVRHPFLDEDMTLGSVLLVQARLMAKFLRDELEGYPPFAWK